MVFRLDVPSENDDYKENQNCHGNKKKTEIINKMTAEKTLEIDDRFAGTWN
jgi:hypothetical protein